jgi:hypothetical protein
MEIWAYETVTGDKLATIPCSPRWEAVLNAAGTVEATVPLRKLAQRTRRDLLTYLEPARISLAAVTSAHRVIEAGPIWTHRFSDKSGDLTVSATGLWSIFDKRKMIDPSWEKDKKVQDSMISVRGATLARIAQIILQLSAQRGSLPLVWGQLAQFGDPYDRDYPGFEMKWVGDALRELSSMSGGPEIALEPRVREDGDGIEHVVRIGAPLLTQTGDDWLWDRGARRSGVTSLDVDVDATGVGQRAWAVGNGMDTGILIASAEDTASLNRGYPLTEVEASQTSVADKNAVLAHAVSALTVAQKPWQTWGLTVSDTAPELGLYRPGDWARVVVPKAHEYLPAGPYRTRILSFSGDQSHNVTVRLAPTLEAR